MCILRFSNESLPGVFDAYLRCLRHPCAHERNMHSPHCCVFTVVAQCLASRGKPRSAIFMRIYVVWGLSGVHRQACESHFGHPIRGIWLHFSCVLMGFGPHMVTAVKKRESKFDAYLQPFGQAGEPYQSPQKHISCVFASLAL